jgi:hypothetical protein
MKTKPIETALLKLGNIKRGIQPQAYNGQMGVFFFQESNRKSKLLFLFWFVSRIAGAIAVCNNRNRN